MNRNETSRRKRLLIGVLAFLGLILLLMFFPRPGGMDRRREPQGTPDISDAERAHRKNAPRTGATEWVRTKSAAPKKPARTGPAPFTFDYDHPSGATARSGALALSSGTLSGIAVVDMEKILAAHPPTDESPAAKKNMLRLIQEAVVRQSTARNFRLTFDLTAQSQSGSAVFPRVNLDKATDLTGEVLDDLRSEFAKK